MAHIHILGICGTFMGGVARLARDLGHDVTGSDQNVYPPMSTLLNEMDVGILRGYDPAHLQPKPDLVVIGNALSRGNPAVEAVLNDNIPFTSGPAWLHDHMLGDRHVLAIAGTHGKTSTASALAWILEQAGLAPGFLIGGVPANFPCSARLGDSKYFVVEADEYDSAFFDKRSKFIHYRPSTLVINNLEFDHADIFENLAAIRQQFHHLMRIVPGNGKVIVNGADDEIQRTLELGCWTPLERFFAAKYKDVAPPGKCHWSASPHTSDYRRFNVQSVNNDESMVDWSLIGQHNMANGLAAIAAAHAVGVPLATACEALATFLPTKRRLEFLGDFNGIRIYEDFAHHPTAIRVTLEALRTSNSHKRLIAAVEPRSNTMRMGVHTDQLEAALNYADLVYFYKAENLSWDAERMTNSGSSKIQVVGDIDSIIDSIATQAQTGDCVVIMSNGDFEGLPRRLVARLTEFASEAVG